MQRTLDVILTTANFKSAHDEGEERRKEENGNTIREIVQYEPKRNGRAPKLSQVF